MPIRYALPPDADVMAEITCAAFAEFEDFDVTREQSAANWRRNLLEEAAERPRPHHTRIAELPDGTVIGLVMGGPADPELGLDAEIYALAVRPGHQGRGHGRALLRAVAADLRADGFGSLAIRVLAVNERARRFYTSLGGVFAGEVSPDEVFYAWPEIAALARALVPEGFDDYLTHFEHALEGTRLLALGKRVAESAAWEPDDPRIAELATALADHYLANPALLKTVTGLQARTEAAARYTLIAHHGEEQTPAAARLAALFETKLRAAGIHIPRPDSH